MRHRLVLWLRRFKGHPWLSGLGLLYFIFTWPGSVWLLDKKFGEHLYRRLPELPTAWLTMEVVKIWALMNWTLFLVFVGGLLFQMWRESRPRPVRRRETKEMDASRYAMHVDHGHALLVRWRASPTEDERRLARDEAMTAWLSQVRRNLRRHYGNPIAIRFNFPSEVVGIGLNEPAEHEARLRELSRIVDEIRRGILCRRKGR